MPRQSASTTHAASTLSLPRLRVVAFVKALAPRRRRDKPLLVAKTRRGKHVLELHVEDLEALLALEPSKVKPLDKRLSLPKAFSVVLRDRLTRLIRADVETMSFWREFADAAGVGLNELGVEHRTIVRDYLEELLARIDRPLEAS